MMKQLKKTADTSNLNKKAEYNRNVGEIEKRK